MGEIVEPNKDGDARLTWDPENEGEVDAAKALFDSLKKKRYFAYTVKEDGGKGEVIHEFDPDAEKIIMALPMRGG
jgi:hypothetical protein